MRGDGVEAGHDGLPLGPGGLPLAPPRRRGPARPADRHALAVGLGHQERPQRRGAGGVERLRVEGGHVGGSLARARLQRLEAQRQAQDAPQQGLRLAVRPVRRAVGRPLAQQVRVAAGGQPQLRVEGADDGLARGGEGVAREDELAEDRVVAHRPPVVVAQRRPVGADHRPGRARGGAGEEEEAQQRRPQRQQAAEQRPLHRVGGARPRLRAGHVGQQRLELLAHLRDNRRGGGRHGTPPARDDGRWYARILAHEAPAAHRPRPPTDSGRTRLKPARPVGRSGRHQATAPARPLPDGRLRAWWPSPAGRV